MVHEGCRCDTDEFQKELREKMPDEDTIMDLSDLFKLFGDSTRLRILWALKDNEICVDGISTAIGVSQSAVSHQLRVLKEANLVRSRRDGKWIYYTLCDDHIVSLLNIAIEHLMEGPE